MGFKDEIKFNIPTSGRYTRYHSISTLFCIFLKRKQKKSQVQCVIRNDCRNEGAIRNQVQNHTKKHVVISVLAPLFSVL